VHHCHGHCVAVVWCGVVIIGDVGWDGGDEGLMLCRTINNNNVVVRCVLATLQLVTWHLESPVLLSMCLVPIQLVMWHCHIILAVLVVGDRCGGEAAISDGGKEATVVRRE